MKSRNAVKLAMKVTKSCFIILHSSVFGKVRELVGEIKYAFVASAMINGNIHLFTGSMRFIYLIALVVVPS